MIFGSLSFLESVSQSWQKYFHLNKTLNFLYMFSILQPLPNFCSSFTKVIAFGEMLQWFKEGGTSNSSSFYSLTIMFTTWLDIWGRLLLSALTLGENPRLYSFWELIIRRFSKRLAMWKANYLSFGGRLTLIKSALINSPLPILIQSLW